MLLIYKAVHSWLDFLVDAKSHFSFEIGIVLLKFNLVFGNKSQGSQ